MITNVCYEATANGPEREQFYPDHNYVIVAHAVIQRTYSSNK